MIVKMKQPYLVLLKLLHYVQFVFNLGWRSKLSPIPHAPLPNLPTLDLNHLCRVPKIQLGHLSLLQLHGAHFLNPIHLDQPTDHIGAFTAFAGALLRSLPTPHLTFHRSLKHLASVFLFIKIWILKAT